jgi:hypothetical protein
MSTPLDLLVHALPVVPQLDRLETQLGLGPSRRPIVAIWGCPSADPRWALGPYRMAVPFCLAEHERGEAGECRTCEGRVAELRAARAAEWATPPEGWEQPRATMGAEPLAAGIPVATQPRCAHEDLPAWRAALVCPRCREPVVSAN